MGEGREECEECSEESIMMDFDAILCIHVHTCYHASLSVTRI